MNGMGVDVSVCLRGSAWACVPGLIGRREGLTEPGVMWVGGRWRHKRSNNE